MSTAAVVVRYDYQELTRYARANKVKYSLIKQSVYDSLETTSMRILNQIKDQMPKDTWRATRSWGKDSGFGGNAKNPFNPGDPVWETNWRGSRTRYNEIWILQDTNLPYIEALNAGSSTQAPAGFIEAIVEEHDGEFEDLLMSMLPDTLFA